MTLRLEPFSRTELQKVHAATVRILERTGVRILDPEAASYLRSAGATYDDLTQVVRIPEGLLKELLMRAPSRFHLHGRGPDRVLAFGEGKTYFSSMGTAVQVEDEQGRVRPPTLKDVESFYRLADASPFLDHASWVVWPRDIPNEAVHLYELLYGFKFTTKSLDGYNWGKQFAQDTIDMAAIVAGGREELAQRPLLLGFTNPVSPLTLAKETTEGLVAFARAGQPCIMPPECMAGGTAPATLAGVLVQQNAEVLASIAVAEAVHPGAPVLYGSVSTVMDMRDGSVALGAPEAGLISLGAAQLARYYGIPSRGTGGNTEALGSDYQAGAESATTLLLSALAGFDFIYDVAGSLESSLSASYAKMILDDDLAGAVRRVLHGIEVTEDTLATEGIEAAGLHGSYLGHPHTLSHFRREHFLPETFLRGTRVSREGIDVCEKARRRADAILREHTVDPPLETAIESKLTAFVKRAMKRPAGVAVPAA
ncbi:MAG TPA: trimethylamine methyltransferase family protein [Thermoplasmata archaeon]|nr:trimethylamine methyltransferase family protein [Thermoplasmata archaeon]